MSREEKMEFALETIMRGCIEAISDHPSPKLSEFFVGLMGLCSSALARNPLIPDPVEFEATVQYEPIGQSKIVLPYRMDEAEDLRYHRVKVTIFDMGPEVEP